LRKKSSYGGKRENVRLQSYPIEQAVRKKRGEEKWQVVKSFQMGKKGEGGEGKGEKYHLPLMLVLDPKRKGGEKGWRPVVRGYLVARQKKGGKKGGGIVHNSLGIKKEREKGGCINECERDRSVSRKKKEGDCDTYSITKEGKGGGKCTKLHMEERTRKRKKKKSILIFLPDAFGMGGGREGVMLSRKGFSLNMGKKRERRRHEKSALDMKKKGGEGEGGEEGTHANKIQCLVGGGEEKDIASHSEKGREAEPPERGAFIRVRGEGRQEGLLITLTIEREGEKKESPAKKMGKGKN